MLFLERPYLFVEYENTDVESSQHSLNENSNPSTTFAFSSSKIHFFIKYVFLNVVFSSSNRRC